MMSRQPGLRSRLAQKLTDLTGIGYEASRMLTYRDPGVVVSSNRILGKSILKSSHSPAFRADRST